MRTARPKRMYVVCLSNAGYPASLETGKIYPTVEDPAASRRGLLRVLDESGDGYLFPKARFARIKLPRNVERALTATG